MGYIIVIGIILLVCFFLVYYFFNIAFVKQNMGDLDDVDALVNKPLENYKEIIREGINFINSTPHKWVETVSFDGLKLTARYFDNKSEKTVIFFHGYRSSASRDFSCAVKMYLAWGFNVLLVDQRSHGRSEGRLITFGVKERRDAVLWAEYAVEKLGALNIVLSGMSMGATTVLLSCGLTLPKEVRCIIADCGFTSPVEIIKKVAKDNFKIDVGFFLPVLNACCVIFGKFSIYGINTADAVKKSNIPILFVHGKADKFVPCEMSEQTFKSANSKSRILTVENASHGLSFLVDTPLVESELKKFLKENIS